MDFHFTLYSQLKEFYYINVSLIFYMYINVMSIVKKVIIA